MPVRTFKITQLRIPNIIPFAIEYVNGIMITAINPPNTSAISPSNVIFLIELIIRSPTHTRAGVVANAGIARNTGAKKSEIRKNPAVTTDASPVLPPLATPALDST